MLSFVLLVATVVCAYYVLCALGALFGLLVLGMANALEHCVSGIIRCYPEYVIPLLLGIGPFVLLAIAFLR